MTNNNIRPIAESIAAIGARLGPRSDALTPCPSCGHFLETRHDDLGCTECDCLG